MKSIETRYNGYLFRSRTEARWAIFFDAIGLKYDYEPGGFSLSSGNYLPDFYLPEQKIWVEIKGKTQTEHEWELAKDLSQYTKDPVMMIIGAPRQYRINLISMHQGIRVHNDPKLIVPLWHSLGTIVFAYKDQLTLLEMFIIQETMVNLRGWNLDQWLEFSKDPGDPYHQKLQDAYEKAIYAQFEHGKTPTGPLDI